MARRPTFTQGTSSGHLKKMRSSSLTLSLRSNGKRNAHERNQMERSSRVSESKYFVVSHSLLGTLNVLNLVMKLLLNRAVAARENAAKPPPVPKTTTPGVSSKTKSSATAPPLKKDARKSLKGVVVKKKPKVPASSPTETQQSGRTLDKKHPESNSGHAEGQGPPQAKRRKVEKP